MSHLKRESSAPFGEKWFATSYADAGGFITEHYGRPARGLHALHIEINRALYMNEGTYEPNAGFARLREDLWRFSADLVSIPESCLEAGPLAAE